ncbi:hypothetical protein [Neobacillus cucumis]|uniref:Uncharacterized protein n=1 Tax=Neobacillus cucumis TaxID=1740721 RepID=A0A2N5HSC4_9BACI|nr:hypothetical protein [Neobacillus cucumis]PLS08403.1 hypothetical protein CVD27_03060 [Neobacillus cucumis]
MTILFATLPHAQIGNQDLYKETISNLQRAIEATLQPFLNTDQLKKKGKMLSDLVPVFVSHQVLFLGQKVNKSYIENIVDEIMLPAIKFS